MPIRQLIICSKAGCHELTSSGRCDKHAVRSDYHEKIRATSHERGYNYRWKKARAKHLKALPLCNYCEKKGLIVSAAVVDHVKPHRGDKVLFWDASNWQSLCKSCHDSKTGRGE